jgi:hypothetical protein
MSRRQTTDRPTTDEIGAVVPSNRASTYLDPPSGGTVSTGAGQGETPTPIKNGTTIMTKTTDEVIDRFNQAFQERDATLLEDIIAPDCVMESVQPAPDGTRYEGYDASFSSWKALIEDTTSHFEVEDVHTGDEWALIRWRYVWGPGPDDSVRGVNVMRVIDGKIVEAAGYSKTAPVVAALEADDR